MVQPREITSFLSQALYIGSLLNLEHNSTQFFFSHSKPLVPKLSTALNHSISTHKRSSLSDFRPACDSQNCQDEIGRQSLQFLGFGSENPSLLLRLSSNLISFIVLLRNLFLILVSFLLLLILLYTIPSMQLHFFMSVVNFLIVFSVLFMLNDVVE